MANQEQLEILKQGVEVWNQWREDNSSSVIDLRDADLSYAKFSGINLRDADLVSADLIGADLKDAILFQADLYLANLVGADLRETNLFDAKLNAANLSGARLEQANIQAADLNQANLNGAHLFQTDFRHTTMAGTILGRIDLSQALGLDEVFHLRASQISTDTLQLSKGRIPEVFLRGCGLLDWEIESAKLANPDLSNEEIVEIEYRIHDLRTSRAIKISRLFISYSHADSTFVDKLEKGLNEKGVRFWRDIHDMTAGKIETQIDRAIRQNPTVLLILSKNSMNSDWVQHEVRKARDIEKELGRDALCPIALDDGWKSSRWPQRVMEQVMEYNILDFSKWEDEATFNAEFAKLLNGLDLFYKKPEA